VKIQQVAEDLGVRYVLEGSVHKSGDRLRITAQLIDATTGHHLWAEKYDRDLTDIFAVRDEVTLKIVTALQVKLTEGEWLNAWGAKTDNLEVFVKAKQALEHFRRFNPDDNILARQKAEEALALDPNYAPAMEVLGLALIFDTRWGTSKAPEKSMEKALELAQKLLDRGDYDAHAHQLFGLAYRNKGQFEKAIAELELARAKAPNDAEINALLGAVLRC
jgi:adenylate cyclase